MSYLFVHFIGEEENGEQVYFSISQDGFHWTDLGKGPVLVSKTGEMGIRDPFIVRSNIDQKFYILATDLRIANKKGWDVAQYEGSTSLIVWKSDDLIQWSPAQKIDFERMDEAGAGCVWAPEAFWDQDKKAYLVYWASMINGKQRIYAAWTKDFSFYENFHLHIEKNGHIIDTTMAKENEIFYRFSACGEYDGILLERGNALEADDYLICTDAMGIAGTQKTEGPIIVWLESIGKWCLYVDDIGRGAGYIPFVTNSLRESNFVRVPESEYDFGMRKKRHGSILTITDIEYERLLSYYGVYVPVKIKQ